MNSVPCPGRIIVDLGDGFSTGCAMGALWYFVKGSYYAVRRERIKGGLALLRSRAPILGGSFAMWACFFSISSCIMVYIRQREDPVNSIIAGFTTGFILAIRGGVRNAIRSAIIGGLFLGIIEGMMVIHQQYQKRAQLHEEMKAISHYKRQFEKQGMRFVGPPKRERTERPQKDKIANVVVDRDMITIDPAAKII